MPAHSHPRPWHRGSEFGDGLRFALDREQRAVWRARLDTGRVTALHEKVGQALPHRLGTDGRCDPSHDTLAADAGCCPRTVFEALKRLAGLGMLRWINRLDRVGDAVRQISNGLHADRRGCLSLRPTAAARKCLRHKRSQTLR